MNWQTTARMVIGTAALLLMATASSPAEVVRTNLRLWLDAGDHNADGVQDLGAGTTWHNKANTGTTHDATLTQGGDGPSPSWGGNGTVASPYAVQFRFVDRYNGGYALVANSAGGTDLDTCVFTYEVWARRNGVGSNGAEQYGALIAHCASQGWGIGGINYTHAACAPMVAGELFGEGGNPVVDSPFPKSAGVFATTRYHHIVLTRAGDGPTDSAFYLDGVLLGRFKTESTNANTDASSLTVGGRLYSPSRPADYFLDCDIAIVRVYGTVLSTAEVLQNYSVEASRFGGRNDNRKDVSAE